jgi:hypothetical protein
VRAPCDRRYLKHPCSFSDADQRAFYRVIANEAKQSESAPQNEL